MLLPTSHSMKVRSEAYAIYIYIHIVCGVCHGLQSNLSRENRDIVDSSTLYRYFLSTFRLYVLVQISSDMSSYS